MSLRRLRSAPLLCVGLALAATGCELLLSSDDGPSTGGAGGTSNAASGTSVGGSVSGPILYIDASAANDVGPGSTPSTAFKSIEAAIARADESVEEIDVCAGTYAGFVLDKPIKVLGGFECAKWTRDEDNLFKGGGSQIQSHDSASALVQITTTIKGESLVEGFVIGGARDDGVVGQSIGVRIDGTTDTVLRKNVITGDPGSAGDTGSASDLAGSIGSAGVLISSGEPTLQDNVIHGGNGAGIFAPAQGLENVGTAGVFVTGGAPLLANNEIVSGVPAKGSIAVGLYVEAQGVYLGNRIYIDSGTGSQGLEGLRLGPHASGGFYGNNLISGGKNGAAFSVGIEARGDTKNIIAFNTVFAGHAGGADAEHAMEIDTWSPQVPPIVVGNFFIGSGADVAVHFIPEASVFLAYPTFQANAWYGFAKAFQIGKSGTVETLAEAEDTKLGIADNHEIFDTCPTPVSSSCVLVPSCSNTSTNNCGQDLIGTNDDPYEIVSAPDRQLEWTDAMPCAVQVPATTPMKTLNGLEDLVSKDYEDQPRASSPAPGAFNVETQCLGG